VSIIETVKERIGEYKVKKAFNEIYHLAGIEIDKGGSLVVDAIVKDGKRIILAMNQDNVRMKDAQQKFVEILKWGFGTGQKIRFTILNKNHEEVASFKGVFRKNGDQVDQ
jgi:hypothetical protein